MLLPNRRMTEGNSELIKQGTLTDSFLFNSEGHKIQSSEDRLLYAKKKLSPLRKGISVDPRAIFTREKRNFKVAFLNIEKLQLGRLYDKIDKSKVETREGGTNRRERKSESEVDIETTNSMKTQVFTRSTLYNRSPVKIRAKAFTIPYERYYYRDFIWKCAFSNNVFH